MAPFMVVEIEVAPQSAPGFVKVGVVVQIDLFVFHAAPQTLDVDVVETAAAAVHADTNLGLVAKLEESLAGLG